MVGSLVLLLPLLAVAGLYFASSALTVESPSSHADVIVVLGGDSVYRPARALKLYQAGAAPRVIATGTNDSTEYQTFLIGKGVPGNAIQIEGNSGSTKENAQFTVPMLRKLGAKHVIIVTSWFHSRRALNCFRHYAPDIQFYAQPTVADQPRSPFSAFQHFSFSAFKASLPNKDDRQCVRCRNTRRRGITGWCTAWRRGKSQGGTRGPKDKGTTDQRNMGAVRRRQRVTCSGELLNPAQGLLVFCSLGRVVLWS